jgi:hypothetical protein
MIVRALRASNCLVDVAAALRQSGDHMTVFRHLMAPPTSQDQFKLICSSWPKGSEKTGAPLSTVTASDVATKLAQWRSRRLAPWIAANRDPKFREINTLILAVAPLIAQQRLATARRNRLARVQEESLMAMLTAAGWEQLDARTIDRQGALQTRQFMHKARFASGITGRAEVDIALGLPGAVVVALECKVTNDETNSVKRVNDVAKKAQAWRAHWGNFVQPAAMLEGVIKRSDVQRLLNESVHVFWSHRLDLFGAWLNEQVDS